MDFILAHIEDLKAIMDIIHDAQLFMRSQNSGQWQDGSPSEATLRSDIEKRQLYIVNDGEIIHGVTAILGHDADYDHLIEGSWKNDQPYLVIHRFAVSSKYRHGGIGTYMLSRVEDLARKRHISDLRVDTHEKNLPMIALLEKNGYEKRGIAMLGGTKERIVFEKVL
jgi:GNAT superfamily N-acetyltransferase